MSKALTTSEANQKLLSLGYSTYTIIEDNEFTLPFGKTEFWVEETTNMFDKNNEKRWWSTKGVQYYLKIDECGNGKSYLNILKFEDNSGNSIVNYAKLSASDKKRFMAIFEELASRKSSYSIPVSKDEIKEITVYGNVSPTKFVEL